jgi:hypothetical protein
MAWGISCCHGGLVGIDLSLWIESLGLSHPFPAGLLLMVMDKS